MNIMEASTACRACWCKFDGQGGLGDLTSAVRAYFIIGFIDDPWYSYK